MKTNTPNEILSSVSPNYEETKVKTMSTVKATKRKPASTRVIKRNSLASAPVTKAKTTKVKSTKKSFNVAQFISEKSAYTKSVVKNTLDKVLNRGKKTKKSTRKPTKLARLEAKRRRKNVILGIGLFLVVLSIAYSTTVVGVGIETLESRIALAPQVAFALYITFKAFSNINK